MLHLVKLFALLPLLASMAAGVGASPVLKREVPLEHSHRNYNLIVQELLQLDNPAGIADPVFGLLGNGAAAQGAGTITNLDCLQQATADQAFTNAKAAGDIDGMTAALVYRALERNTIGIGLRSVACTETAVNPEIAAIKQHQDPAAEGAAAENKEITLELARQIASVGGDPLVAIDSGTFAPGDLNDNTFAGNTCNEPNDDGGCIFTQNLLIPDASDEEILAAVAGVAQPNQNNAAGNATDPIAPEGGNATDIATPPVANGPELVANPNANATDVLLPPPAANATEAPPPPPGCEIAAPPPPPAAAVDVGAGPGQGQGQGEDGRGRGDAQGRPNNAHDDDRGRGNGRGDDRGREAGGRGQEHDDGRGGGRDDDRGRGNGDRDRQGPGRGNELVANDRGNGRGDRGHEQDRGDQDAKLRILAQLLADSRGRGGHMKRQEAGVDVGACTDFSMSFRGGNDGRPATEFTFLPSDQTNFGGQSSALNPNIIANFMCNQFVNGCAKSAATRDVCRTVAEDLAQQEGAGQIARDQSFADAWLAGLQTAFGIQSTGQGTVGAAAVGAGAGAGANNGNGNGNNGNNQNGNGNGQAANNGNANGNGNQNGNGQGANNGNGNGNNQGANAGNNNNNNCNIQAGAGAGADAGAGAGGAGNGAGAGNGENSGAGGNNGAAAGAGNNVQTFTGALNGATAPPVIQSGGNRPFSVNGNTFQNLGAAINRSCAIQHNACANAFNSGGGDSNVAACDAQEQECLANGQAARIRRSRVYRA